MTDDANELATLCYALVHDLPPSRLRENGLTVARVPILRLAAHLRRLTVEWWDRVIEVGLDDSYEEWAEERRHQRVDAHLCYAQGLLSDGEFAEEWTRLFTIYTLDRPPLLSRIA